MLSVLQSLFLAPIYLMLSAAMLVQGRTLLPALQSLIDNIGKNGIPDNAVDILDKFKAFIIEAFMDDGTEFTFEFIHVVLFANLLALLSISFSSKRK